MLQRTATLQQRSVHEANKDHNADPTYKVGDWVLLATAHRWRDYMQAKDGHVTKFMPHFDGQYNLVQAYLEFLSYTPLSSKAHPTFHVSHLQLHIPNNDKLFPLRAHHPPQPLVTVNGTAEYFINWILNRWPCGRGHQYLIWWMGYGPEHDLWLPRLELIDTEALEKWKAENHAWGIVFFFFFNGDGVSVGEFCTLLPVPLTTTISTTLLIHAVTCM